MTADESALRIGDVYIADDDLVRALRADAGLDPDDFDDYHDKGDE